MNSNLLGPLRIRDFRLLFGGDHRLGAATVMFAVAGVIVAATALIGFASGVAGRMRYEPIEASEA